jgi:hypothetical protein
MHEEGTRELNAHEPNAIDAVVGWLGPMRRGDIDAVAEWFDAHVRWHGLGGTPCRDRVEVLEMLGDSFKPCPGDPASFQREPGLGGVEIALDPDGPAEQAHGLPGIGQPISRERRTP